MRASFLHDWYGSETQMRFPVTVLYFIELPFMGWCAFISSKSEEVYMYVAYVKTRVWIFEFNAPKIKKNLSTYCVMTRLLKIRHLAFITLLSPYPHIVWYACSFHDIIQRCGYKVNEEHRRKEQEHNHENAMN